MQIILRGQPWAPCPQKHIKCWPETLAIASWDLLIPHSVPPAAPPPPPLPPLYLMLSTPPGVLDFSVFVVCVFPYMKACLSKQRHHMVQQHTRLLLSGLLIYCSGGENAKNMQNQSFHIYVIHITFALWELSILLLCVCGIALGIGPRILDDEYSPVTCRCCAVIENMICACRENCSSPTCL